MNRWATGTKNQEEMFRSSGGQGSRFSDMDWNSSSNTSNMQGGRSNSYGYENESSRGMTRGANDPYSVSDSRNDINRGGIDRRRDVDNYRVEDDYTQMRDFGSGVRATSYGDVDQDRFGNRDERYSSGVNDRNDRRNAGRFDIADERDDRLGYKQNSGFSNRTERGRFNEDVTERGVGRSGFSDRGRNMDESGMMNMNQGVGDTRVRGMDGLARKRGVDSIGMNTGRNDDNLYRNRGMENNMNRGMDNMNLDRGLDGQNMNRGFDNMNTNRVDSMNMNRDMDNLNRNRDTFNRNVDNMNRGMDHRGGQLNQNEMNMQMRGGMSQQQNYGVSNVQNTAMSYTDNLQMNKQHMVSDDRMSGDLYGSSVKRPRMNEFDRRNNSGLNAGNEPVRGGYAGSSSNITRKSGREPFSSRGGPSATTQAGKFLLKRTLQSGSGNIGGRGGGSATTFPRGRGAPAKPDSGKGYRCEVCDIKMSTLKIYRRHLEGKYHLEKVAASKKPASKPKPAPARKVEKVTVPAPTVKKPEPVVKEEKVPRNPNAKGREYVVAVTGFFCKLCRKFFNSEGTAKETHCASADHIDRYEKKEALKKSIEQAQTPKAEPQKKIFAKKEQEVKAAPKKTPEPPKKTPEPPKKAQPEKFIDKLKKDTTQQKPAPKREEVKKPMPAKPTNTKPVATKKPTPKPSPITKKPTPTKPASKAEKSKPATDLSSDFTIIDDIDSDAPIVINGALCDDLEF